MTGAQGTGGKGPPVRVLVCDDSVTVRAALAGLIGTAPDLAVVGTAGDGRQALARIAALPATERPEVVLLDLEMPVMDGMTVLPHLLALPAPRPAVIVASALTQRGAAAAMAALRAGAVDYVPKPSAAGGGLRDPGFRAEMLAKIRGWGRMARDRGPALAPAAIPAAAAPAAPAARARISTPRVVAIGTSTGGPQALSALIRGLDGPELATVPFVVVQHMPQGFTAMLADHLNRLGGPPCAEARDGEALQPGRIYVAPGDRHLLVEAGRDKALLARLSDGPAENFCRPAVDPLLRSLAVPGIGPVLAVIMTGMGQDGLAGCRAIRDAGGAVLAQDEASSVVWGMPGAVVRAGLAAAVLPPAGLAAEIRAALRPGGEAMRTGRAA